MRVVFRPVSLVGLLLFALTACESGSAPRETKALPPAVATAAAATATAPAPTAAPGNAANEKPNGVEWRGDIQWHTWNDALSLASRESKPIMVVVYADWCPHCRDLGPVFADPEIERLAKRFVMVRQNHDESPAWLEPYNQKYGGYVPRIFFFDSSGKMQEDVTSGHPRYPYFYAAEQPEYLKKSMRRAAGT
jgi:thiol:disulfide interchange protein